MSSYTFSQRQFTPTPPERGSFPLDHEGHCKSIMIRYMRCLSENRHQNAMCRDIAKEYLGCRMDHDLMTREDWSKLGFTDEIKGVKET
ncbi:Cytochrome c oxidase assembly protein COX19 [Trachymyrmex septentrionalis]|uniref:Cytochrome c oxidase assembly protein COX19 n=1 Tax=Trachymyrmex septentrionalis TaxID=34720 RepID=A0A195FKY1_9HYME|nr:PREDICTED: cytochrome c oxidase assembly protein COX19 [Trachymyrmex septentrionalis]KYN41325.1 Cytochrome c oxidase assembly protein COX19 [Trachymyrmex septentrionalis]